TRSRRAAPRTKEGPRNGAGNPQVRGSVRTCVGCRRQAAPDELVRIGLRADGRPAIGSLPGRGAWLCRGTDTVIAASCLEAAIRRQAFVRAFRTPVPPAGVEALRAEGTKRARIEGGAPDRAVAPR